MKVTSVNREEFKLGVVVTTLPEDGGVAVHFVTCNSWEEYWNAFADDPTFHDSQVLWDFT